MSVELNPSIGSTKKSTATLIPQDTGQPLTEDVKETSAKKSLSEPDETLNPQSVFIQGLNLSVEVERHQGEMLRMLEEKISKKKKEFEEMASGQDTTKGEKHDLQRALARMDRLLDIPKNSNLLKMFPNVFNTYVSDLIHNLLELDARTLNYALACTPVRNPNAEKFDGYIQHVNPIPTTNDEAEKKITEELPKWDNTNVFFYLNQLPIVIKGTGLPEFHRTKLKEVGVNFKEKDTIPEADIKKLFEAAALIDRVGWTNSNPESLKNTESICILESATTFKAIAGAGHTIIVMDEKTSPISLSDTLIHEDDHNKNRDRFNKIFIHELKTRKENESPANIQHPWFREKNGSTSVLLFELSAYGTATSFLLDVWDTEGKSSLFKSIELVEKFIPYKRNAKLAIKLAKENSKHLNEDGKKWLTEMETLWDKLDKRIHPNIQAITSYLLKSGNAEYIRAGLDIQNDYSQI